MKFKLATERKFVATRDNTDSRFQIVVSDAKSHELSHCEAGSAFASMLATLTTIVLRRTTRKPERDALNATRARDFRTLRIATATAIEPLAYRVLLTARHGPVVLMDGAWAYESSVPSLTIEQLEQGCAALGAK